MIYTGIGSRQTPPDVLALMTSIASDMTGNRHILRSGGADGADSAFEAGVNDPGLKEIYLPWLGFNGNPSRLLPTPAAFEMAAKFHPAWGKCSQGARKLHARNCHQILGASLASPSDRVICWTPNASGSGGTGQALRIAKHYGITIHDLGDPRIKKLYAEEIQCR